MMSRNTAAARVIPAPADPDTISDSGSSTSVPPPQPGRKQTNPVLQVVRAGVPVIPTPEDGQPVAAVDEATSQVVKSSARAVVAAGKAINSYLRTHGRIPMIRSEGPDLDLNALAPPDASRPPRQVDRPVICAYCNCAFCFAAHEFPSLNPVPGHVYPAPPVPITLNLLTPPPVGPLYRDPRGPGATPARLLVCSCEHHFKVTMGMLQQQPGGAPSLVWKCTISCLRVLPIVVGSEGANSPDLHANPAPPPEPWTYAGAYWNYVKPGDEDMVKLKLHDDPLNLTLGRR
ncbi:unnamed protein product [Miscanthus lutarioriparius]|uniref:Uncharacterized protein n=1 Tax=Miscanthus lutarioriparius TaxID=422564 RepID=A0A811PK63_9POAL|nr:unnamed protein product [Miscanthus lutarioriparius]